MGVSSSQPVPSSQDNRSSPPTAKSAATPSLARPGPRYSPTMDDEAASQQLMSEARATTHSADYQGPAIPLNFDGASQTTATETPESGRKKTRRLGRMQASHRETLPGSPLPTYSLRDLQTFIGTPPSKSRAFRPTISSTQIEVPDSQAEMQANGVPSPTSLTASQTVSPRTSNKRIKKGKKSKKDVQSEAEPNSSNAIPATPYERSAGGAMPSSSEAPKSQGSRGKDKPRTSTNSVDLDTPEVVQTLAAAQDEGLDKQNRILDAEELPLTPRDRFEKLNAERSLKSQAASKFPSSADALDVTRELEVEAEAADAAALAATSKTPGTSAGKRKRTKKGKKSTETPIAEQSALIDTVNDTPSQSLASEDSDAEGASSHGEQSSKRGKRPRYSVGGIAIMRKPRVSRANPNRTYQRARDDDDDRTAADKALEMTHELGHPPDKRTSGEYTADEKELIRRAIRDYQERSGLDAADLVEIIQWTPRREQGNSDHQTEEQFKNDCNAFWDEINNAGLLRKLRDLRKHIRATYHTCQRGRWSKEDDEQLRDLVNLHPGQWRLIATQLNRLEIDAYNRWKDYVRHGTNRNTKRWTTDEEENLVRVLSMVCQRVEDMRAKSGKPALDDYYPVINWHEVCRELDDSRSRLQCQSKWKIMRARVPPATLDVEIKPRSTPPHEDASAKKKIRKSKVKKSRQAAVAEVDLSPPGADDMLWGDKFDLIAELSEQAATNEITSDDEIAWKEVAKNMNHRWSVRTLQTAFKQLCELALDGEGNDDDDEDLTHRLALLFNYIKENHRDEIEDRYQAAQDIEVDVEDEPQVNSSKKRKRQSGAGSEPDSAKRQTKRTLSTAKAFKSKELVTDSEPEE
ncbi:DNA-binding protein REB1 [Stagonosporopsis vannaccii]|nr:DNA-binding protein REB1 [Stagonosporopsis vannaccii]